MDYQDAEQQALRLELDRRSRDWEKRLADMRRELDRKDSLIEQERERTELMAFIQRRKSELRDEVAPELMSFITGDSIEAIEDSIERAREKTASILEGIRQVQVPPGPAEIPQQGGPQQQAPQPQQLTLQQLRDVEVGSAQHMALRRQYGMTRGRGRGLFDQ